MKANQVLAIISVSVALLLIQGVFYFCQYYPTIMFTEQDQKCIQSEWRRSSQVEPTMDFGSFGFRISFADHQHLFQWLHLPKMNSPEILIMISSKPDNFSRRNILRNAWKMNRFSFIKYLFFVGLGGKIDPRIRNIVLREAVLYGDMVVADMEDIYENLSVKTLSLLLYSTSKTNSTTKLIGKMDEDVMFFPDQLLNMVENRKIQIDGDHIYGQIVEAGWPARSEKEELRAPLSSFGCPKYPEYLSGPLYLVTRSAAKRILEASKHRNFVVAEDVLITGILATDVGVKRNILNGAHLYPELPSESPILAWHAVDMSDNQFLHGYSRLKSRNQKKF